MTTFDHAWTLELAPELALGVLTGPQRAEALEHLSTCAPCRTTVARHNEVVDAITLVAPEIEPPPGFEDRVLRRISAREDEPWWRRRDGRRRAVVVIMAAAAVAIVSIATVQIVNAARDPNRDVLATGRAPALRKVAITSGTGEPEGHFAATLGTPSVGSVVVSSALPNGNYGVEIVRTSGPEHIGTVPVLNGNGSWFGTITGGIGNGAIVRLVSPSGTEVARGQLLAG
ncbi:MAG: hypothetical protein JWL73_1558 [Actinomycetia bacterium]|nr:hypothetical protein [Actinomycetes bacterium]